MILILKKEIKYMKDKATVRDFFISEIIDNSKYKKLFE